MSTSLLPPEVAQVYLVGGAVRDRLLGLTVRERDWVVVGADAATLVARDFQRVGKAFPVFLHPETQEEYALARTESKVGPGYKGFEFEANGVTLEEDLRRRDLTINAIAEDAAGRLIDPYGGEQDLRARVLRHVSPAFNEDPLRVLRVARFAAKLASFNFNVAPETMVRMRAMVASGEMAALTPERVWLEWRKALETPQPSLFITVLQQCGALNALLPELDAAWSQATATALDAAATADAPAVARFAINLVPLETTAIDAIGERYRLPQQYHQAARLMPIYHKLKVATGLRTAQGLLDLLEGIDAFRRPSLLMTLLQALPHLKGSREDGDRDALLIQSAYEHCALVQAKTFVDAGLRGPEIAQAIRRARHAAIVELLSAEA